MVFYPYSENTRSVDDTPTRGYNASRLAPSMSINLKL